MKKELQKIIMKINSKKDKCVWGGKILFDKATRSLRCKKCGKELNVKEK